MIDKYKPLWELVYNDIAEKILNGEYEPGRPLIASQLSMEFGVSVSPIREAMRFLENEGLVTIIPHKGITVTEYDIRDIRHIYEVRRILEPEATIMAALNVTAETITYLEGLYQEMVIGIQTEEYQRHFVNNTLFHKTIFDSSGNPWLSKTIYDLWGKSRRSNAAVKYNPAHRRRMLRDHGLILQAIKERRAPSEIKKIVSEHVVTAMEGVIDYIAGVAGARDKTGGAWK